MFKMSFKLSSMLLLVFSFILTSCSNNRSDTPQNPNENNTSTHEHTFSNSYEYDDNYHWHSSTCGHDVQSGKGKHSFISSITEPTYESGGYTTYTCSTCGYSYIDNETDALTHHYSNEWTYDSSAHWHACIDYGYENLRKDESNHTFTTLVTEPTYESGGYTTYTCSTCGYSYTDDETDALTHHYSNEWTYNSSTHWHACTDEGCEDLKKDEDSHTFTTSVTDPTYESGGYTTYTCSTCGYSYTDDETDALTHHYSNEWTYNSSTHWHACTDEGYEDLKKDEESHTFTTSVTDPTYESGGYTTYTCTTCGYTCTGDDTEPLPITITRKNYDGTILEVDNNVPYGSVPSYDGTTPTKESDDNNNYYFSGWTPKVEKATENATYTATFASEEITYTIDFDLNGGLSDSYKGPLEVKSFSKDFFFFDCVKDDWSFRGWEYQNEKIFDEKGNQLKNVTLVDNMVFKAIYSQTVKLTIATNMPEAGTITGEGEYPYNTYVDVSVKPNQGYKFVGWYYQNTLLSNEEVYKYMMWDEDITLEARFERDDFNLRIYTNNKDYGLVLLKSNSVIDDYLPEYADLKEYGSEVTIAAYSKSDVRFLGWYDENNNLVTTNAVYTFVMPNYDYALEAKWDYFTINYNLNGGVNNPNNPDYYTLSDDIINLESPTKEGYSFLGWKCNGEFVDKIDTSIANNITLEAVWSDYRYKIYNDDNDGKYASIISFNDSIIDVIIPESISFENQIIPVKKIDEDAFKNNSKIRSITIPISVISLGNNAFYNCSNLTTVSISENSRLTTIGDYAFYDCSSLTSIYIPSSATTIGSYAFYMCSNLTIYCEAPSRPSGWDSYWNYSNRPEVWSSNGEHGEYNGFTYGVSMDSEGNPYITITGYNGSNTNVVIPEYIEVNGEQIVIKEISNSAFRNNTEITSINIPDGVTSISCNAFYGCSSLTSIYIPDSLTTIGSSAFEECSNLTTVTFGENSQLTTIGDYAFYDCSSLTSIYIPSSATTIGSYAFRNCSNLTIYCEVPSEPSGWDSSWNYNERPVVWNSYKGIHDNLNGLEYVACYDEDGNPYITITGYNGSNTDVVILEYINVNGEDIIVNTIAEKAFYDNDTITSVTIPDSVTTIGSYAFRNCSNLTIYCEVPSKPSGWDSSWNYNKRPVVWNSYKGIHDNLNGLEYVACYDKDGNPYITITGYNGSNTDVVIPEYIEVNGEQIVIKEISNTAFRNNTVITSINIPDGVTSIGNRAFYGCSNLKTVAINSRLTTIGDSAFYNCYSLTSIYIPHSVTAIGSYAFYMCSNLTIYCEAPSEPSGWKSYWNHSHRPVLWSSYNGIYGNFSGFEYGVCIDEDGNKYITILGYNGSNTNVVIPEYIKVNGKDIIVKTIADNAFYNNFAITSVTISDSVTSIGDYAFYHCSSLTSINIPNSVTTIGSSAFDECSNLTTVRFGENSQLTTIGNSAFSHCSSLISINIPNSVTKIGDYAFSHCSSLISIYVPDNVTTIGDSAFYNCSKLTAVTIGEESQLTTIGVSAFSHCSSLISINIPNSVTKIGHYAFYNCSSLTSIYIPNSVTTIGSYAFSHCSSLTSIYIPDSVTTIGYYAFENCSNLTICCEVPFSPSGWDNYWNSSKRPIVWNCIDYGITAEGIHYGVLIDEDGNKYITITGYSGSYTNVVVSEYINVNGENIIVKTIADNAFYNNDTITSVTIPNSVTTIGSLAFYNCYSLTSIYISSSVTTIGSSAFDGCTNLTIYCQACSKPSGWADYWWNSSDRPVVWSSYLGIYGYFNDFEYGVCIDEDGNKYITITGYNASNTDVVIPESINVNGEDVIVKAIADNAFYNNDTITSVTISDCVTFIGDSAFYSCSSLISINIPNSVTKIGDYAFYNCSKLTSVTIGEESQLTTIGYAAFSDCSSLTSIYIPSSVTIIGSYAFDGCSNLTIYCQASSEPSGWSGLSWNYSNRPVVWETTYEEYLAEIA